VVFRVLGLLGGFAAAVLLVTLAVANRHLVRLVLDPFDPSDPVLAVELPFYAYLFAALIIGVVLGGIATWLNQARWRRAARARAQDAMRWKAEAERFRRERDAIQPLRRSNGSAAAGPERKQLALTGH
jgi:uncharacterized integral membrane protein